MMHKPTADNSLPGAAQQAPNPETKPKPRAKRKQPVETDTTSSANDSMLLQQQTQKHKWVKRHQALACPPVVVSSTTCVTNALGYSVGVTTATPPFQASTWKCLQMRTDTAEADLVRQALTTNIFVPETYRPSPFAQAQAQTQAQIKKAAADQKVIRSYVELADGFIVPRFWPLPAALTTPPPVKARELFFCKRRLQPHQQQPHDQTNAATTTAHPPASSPTPSTAAPPLLEKVGGAMRPGMQAELHDHILQSWDKHGGATLVLFCGGGKTELVMSAWHTHRSRLRDGSRGRLGILVSGLMEMWALRCAARFPSAKIVVLSGKSKPTAAALAAADIVVISMHLAALSGTFDLFCLDLDYLVVDESHDIGGAELVKSTQHIGLPRYILAMTATPERWDGMGKMIYWLFGPELPRYVRPKPAYAITVHMVGVRVPDKPNSSMPPCTQKIGTRHVFNSNLFYTYLAQSDRWMEAVLQSILWHHQHVGPTIVFFKRLQLLEDVAETLRLKTPDLSVALLYGKISKEDRVIHSPVDIILANTAVGRQGHDWPWLQGIIFATGMAGNIVQETGRGRRDHPGKTQLVVSYLCPLDNMDASDIDKNTNNSQPHTKAVESATQQACFFLRARADNDGLQADRLVFTSETHMELPTPFVNMDVVRRRTITVNSSSAVASATTTKSSSSSSAPLTTLASPLPPHAHISNTTPHKQLVKQSAFLAKYLHKAKKAQ